MHLLTRPEKKFKNWKNEKDILAFKTDTSEI